MSSSLLITHGQVFTLGQRNELIPDGAIYVEGDTIVDVGPTAALAAKYPAAERLDAGGKLVLPASVCGHTHFYGAFARGMAIPGAPATNFVEILERLWWKLDRALLWDDVRYSALVCLVDAIRHGCTTLIDHHASPNAIDGSLDIIADAVKETGLRASLCYEVTDRNGMDGARAGIAENVRFLKRCRQRARPATGRLLRPARRHHPLGRDAGSQPRRSRGPQYRLPHPRGRGHRRPGRQPAQVQPARGRAPARSSASWGRRPSPSTASTWTRSRRTSCARPAPG